MVKIGGSQKRNFRKRKVNRTKIEGKFIHLAEIEREFTIPLEIGGNMQYA